MGEGVERRQLLLILLLLLLSCVQRFLGGGLCPVLFCFLCNSPVECFASSFTRTEVTFSLFIYLYKSCGGV